jgi:hypothetical protein
VVRDRQPGLRIERLTHRVVLVEESPRIEFPLVRPAQVTEPRMPAIRALTREIKRGYPPRLAGQTGEIGLIRANPAP